MLRKFFASFFTFLFVNFAVLFVLMFGIYRTLFDVSFYEKDLSEFFRTTLVSEISQQVDAEKFSLTKEEFRMALEKSLSNEDIFMAMKEIYSDFNSNTVDNNETKVVISFKWLWLKNQVLSENLADVLFLKLQPCTVGEEVLFESSISCLPKNFSKTDLAKVIERELDLKFFSQVPPNYVFDLQMANNFNPNSPNLFEAIVFNSLLLFGLGSLFFLLLIGLSVYRPAYSVVKWILSAVVSGAFVAIVLVFAFSYLLEASSGFVNIEVEAERNAKLFFEFMSIFANAIKANTLTFLVPIFVISLTGILFVHFRFKKTNEPS